MHSNYDHFSQIERIILNKWQDDKTFKKSLNNSLPEFVFYDGPPFANGLPHYGHLLTGFVKDVFSRYHTMKGKHVTKKIGWDCHGLPAEMYVEKKLNISGKVAIEKYGIEKFNQICESSVLNYTKEWQQYIERQGRWVDFKNCYKTMDLTYMESVIWAFKALYDKNLIYQDTRVMPYSWTCETPVSDFETKIDNAYRQKKSKTVTLRIKLKTTSSFIKVITQNIYLTIWTTTPWTLPANLAIAVKNDVDYIAILKDNNVYIIAETLSCKYKQEIGNNIVSKFKGHSLIGLFYHPPFNYFLQHKNAFQILDADFVTTKDGTGLVHIAPGFGEEDQMICNKNNINLVCPVNQSGKFTTPIYEFVNQQVFDTNNTIIKITKQRNLLLKIECYIHKYPHCWRTDTPLIYRAVPSWYIKVSSIKNQMIANNDKIHWIPSHVKKGLFGKWLYNAHDWSISRNRFWGCPIPVWQSDNPRYPCTQIYGSIAQLEKDFHIKIRDLHRPFIDTLTRDNPNDPTGNSKLRRVPYVLDCWFESGSMPFAQVHYPFSKKKLTKNHLPADFAVEYLAQTRGWFYTLLVLSTALFNKPPFLNAICHGVILSSKKQKLSKRLKNYPDIRGIFHKYGADTLRIFMLSSPVMNGQELVIDDTGDNMTKTIKNFIQPLWHACQFYKLYIKADKIYPDFKLHSHNILDQYIISKINKLIHITSNALDKYNTIDAYKEIEHFLYILNNWYIRRSRDRFWRTYKDSDKQYAYNILFYCLKTLSTLIAPLAPFISEKIFTSIHSNTQESVHLEKFPTTIKDIKDENLIDKMDEIRDACSAALRIRNQLNIRIRQPLSKVTFIGLTHENIDMKLQRLILNEINVKQWTHLDRSKLSEYADYKLKIHFPILAKRLPQQIKKILCAAQSNKWNQRRDGINIAGAFLMNNEFQLQLLPKKNFLKCSAPFSSNNALVILETNITDELELEGIARDIIRLIQLNRKTLQLSITDYIILNVYTDSKKIKRCFNTWRNFIKEQTLSKNIRTDIPEKQSRHFISLLNNTVKIYIQKI